MQRYAQQIVVPEVGAEGQRKLSGAKVLIIGAGGLGTPVASYLSGAGIGTVDILDGDDIAATNLHRQLLYQQSEVGEKKATVLAHRLNAQNPGIQISAITVMLNNDNATAYIDQYDIICDCTDDADARILIDETCGRLRKPLVYAVVRGWEGYVTVLHHKRGMTLQDIFSHASLREAAADDCAVVGIVNTTCGVAGTLQANEVIKIILGMNSKLDGGILCFDNSLPAFRIFNLQGDADKLGGS